MASVTFTQPFAPATLTALAQLKTALPQHQGFAESFNTLTPEERAFLSQMLHTKPPAVSLPISPTVVQQRLQALRANPRKNLLSIESPRTAFATPAQTGAKIYAAANETKNTGVLSPAAVKNGKFILETTLAEFISRYPVPVHLKKTFYLGVDDQQGTQRVVLLDAERHEQIPWFVDVRLDVDTDGSVSVFFWDHKTSGSKNWVPMTPLHWPTQDPEHSYKALANITALFVQGETNIHDGLPPHFETALESFVELFGKYRDLGLTAFLSECFKFDAGSGREIYNIFNQKNGPKEPLESFLLRLDQVMNLEYLALKFERTGQITALELKDGEEPPAEYRLLLKRLGFQAYEADYKDAETGQWVMRRQPQGPVDYGHLINGIFTDAEGSFADDTFAKKNHDFLMRMEVMSKQFKMSQWALERAKEKCREFAQNPAIKFDSIVEILTLHALFDDYTVDDSPELKFILAAHGIYNKLFGAFLAMYHPDLNQMPGHALKHLKYAFKYYSFLEVKRLLEVSISLTESLTYENRLIKLAEILDHAHLGPYPHHVNLTALIELAKLHDQQQFTPEDFQKAIHTVFATEQKPDSVLKRPYIPGLWTHGSGDA